MPYLKQNILFLNMSSKNESLFLGSNINKNISFGSKEKKVHMKSNFIKEVQKYYISETIKLSIVTSPILNMSIHLQYLSKNYSNVPKPFKYNYFSNSFSLISYLFKQGIKGVYKGNISRLSFTIGTAHLKKHIELNYEHLYKNILKYKFLSELVLFSVVDILFNPILFIETHYVLQNCKSNFKFHENTLSLLIESKWKMFTAFEMSIYRNFLFLSSIQLYFYYPNKIVYWSSLFLAHFITFPFLTVQRNKMARTFDKFNEDQIMLNKKRNIVFKGIFEFLEYQKTFGLSQLYRGFFSYLLSVALWHYYVPSAAKYKYYENLL
jgi:hypothetical protein